MMFDTQADDTADTITDFAPPSPSRARPYGFDLFALCKSVGGGENCAFCSLTLVCGAAIEDPARANARA